MSDGDDAPTNMGALTDALTRCAAKYDRVWRNSLDILVVADAQGVFQAVSPSWTTTLGHAASEVVGRGFEDFVLHDDMTATAQAAASAAAGVDVGGFENRYRHKDGS